MQYFRRFVRATGIVGVRHVVREQRVNRNNSRIVLGVHQRNYNNNLNISRYNSHNLPLASDGIEVIVCESSGNSLPVGARNIHYLWIIKEAIE